VDDAATWGAIAAANALSDLYAMGATPLFGLNLVGWPRDTLPLELLGEVVRGAAEMAARARCPVLGGHSVDALEPHFGMMVLGEAHPGRLLTNAGARPGDRLVLTKPLGTGILSTALKRGTIGESDMAEAVRSMTTLNEGAARAALQHGVHAATDVTGFGLLGHLGQVLVASGVAAVVAWDRLPLLPQALELAAQGAIAGGTERNLAAATNVTWDGSISPVERLLMADAQTSGGLLLAVPPERTDQLIEALGREACLARAIIGTVMEGAPGTIRVRRSGVDPA
jgi:selenide,water dikinase